MTSVPFTAFCPECQAGRTFTVLGFEPVLVGSPPIYDRPRVGCCVCGTSERDALIALSSRVTDDRESLGEISARLNTLDGEVEELREDLHAHCTGYEHRPELHSVKVAPQPHCVICSKPLDRHYVELHAFKL